MARAVVVTGKSRAQSVLTCREETCCATPLQPWPMSMSSDVHSLRTEPGTGDTSPTRHVVASPIAAPTAGISMHGALRSPRAVTAAPPQLWKGNSQTKAGESSHQGCYCFLRFSEPCKSSTWGLNQVHKSIPMITSIHSYVKTPHVLHPEFHGVHNSSLAAQLKSPLKVPA